MTPARKKALARDGFVVLPKIVPRRLVDAALRDINHRLGSGELPGKDAYADSRDYLSEYVSRPAIMDLLRLSPLAGLAERLLGAGRVEPVSQAQVALRFPAPSDDAPAARSVHVDGLYPDASAGGAEPAVARYSFCIGVFLSDVTGPNQGNFTAFPGTHRRIAERARGEGAGALRSLEANLSLPPSRQVEGRAGDAVLFHFQTAHDKARNDSPEIRYMAYFRFYHVDAWRDRSREYLLKALRNPWLEWPGMRGVHGT